MEDQSVSSLAVDSCSLSYSSKRRRKKSSSSSHFSGGSSLASGDRSFAESEDEGGIWVDMFAPFKILVCMKSRHLSGSKILITHADVEFFENFEYDIESTLPLSLQRLFSKGTVRRAIYDLELSILTGKNAFIYMNLYTSSGAALPAHVYVNCINGNRNLFLTEPRTLPACKEKYAVLTIRASSLVGNAIQYGIGFFGPNKIIEQSSGSGDDDRGNSRKRAKTADSNHL